MKKVDKHYANSSYQYINIIELHTIHVRSVVYHILFLTEHAKHTKRYIDKWESMIKPILGCSIYISLLWFLNPLIFVRSIFLGETGRKNSEIGSLHKNHTHIDICKYIGFRERLRDNKVFGWMEKKSSFPGYRGLFWIKMLCIPNGLWHQRSRCWDIFTNEVNKHKLH